MIQQCYSYKVMCHGAVVVGFDYWHGGPEEWDIVFDCRLDHGLMDLVIDFWDLTGGGQERYWKDIKTTDLKQMWLRTVAERPFSLYDARTIGARVAIYFSSLLSNFYQRAELVWDSIQYDLLKQALLSLRKHQPYQHADHCRTHVEAGNVGERLFQEV